jgi:hypothetical protein
MAAIGISEFMFGYAFLYEQTHKNWGALKAAPVLPSLYDEKDKGWDAHLPTIGTDFYYQFKLSDKLSGGNAKYIKNGMYSEPYYRVSLHRKDNNRQHRRLKAHAATNPHTFYVAPEFDTLEDFNVAFLARQITNHSRLIPVRRCDDLPRTDKAQHYITYRPSNLRWRFHSDGEERHDSHSGKDLEKLFTASKNEWRPIKEGSFLEELHHRTIERIRDELTKEFGEGAVKSEIPLLDFNPRRSDPKETLMNIAQALSVTIGTTLVLVGTKADSQ